MSIATLMNCSLNAEPQMGYGVPPNVTQYTLSLSYLCDMVFHRSYFDSLIPNYFITQCDIELSSRPDKILVNLKYVGYGSIDIYTMPRSIDDSTLPKVADVIVDTRPQIIEEVVKIEVYNPIIQFLEV